MANVNKFIDLHLHLDGAISLNIVKKLAKLQQKPIILGSDEEILKKIKIPSEYKNLSDFLKCFAFPLSLLQTKETISEAVRLVLEEAKENGVIYAEIRYAPQLHLEEGLSQEDVILASIDGLKKSPIKANLILCCMRGENNDEQNKQTLLLAKKYLTEDGGVVAIDLAGDEGTWPTSKYRDLFVKAKELGIPFTIHAGETENPESVKLAIEYGAKRIGHGVRIVENQKYMDIVKNSGVCLEMCPTSNLLTSACTDIKKYPLLKFYKYGIHVCINTDDPAIEGINIKHEYDLLEKALLLTKDQEINLLNESIDFAFTSNDVKDHLRKMLN